MMDPDFSQFKILLFAGGVLFFGGLIFLDMDITFPWELDELLLKRVAGVAWDPAVLFVICMIAAVPIAFVMTNDREEDPKPPEIAKEKTNAR